jgi:ribonucleotide monophosphatase NagD (HAD superfamily)
MLGITDKSRILGIGDSFATDIKGANAAGLDALLVARGIHSNDLVGADGTLDGDRIAYSAAAAGVTVIGAMSEFVW